MPEPPVEKLNIDSLQKRAISSKEEKIEKNRPQLETLLEEINRERAVLLENLKELYRSEPDEEVHHGLVKTAAEARKLFYEKVSRAIATMNCTQQLTAESVSNISERFSKATNIVADAMKTHGRYVSAVFVKKYSEFELQLRKLHNLIMQTQSILNRLIDEIKDLDELISEILVYQQRQLEVEKVGENISSLQEKIEKLGSEIDEVTSQLAQIKESPEFKKATLSVEELKKNRQEIQKERETAASLVSEFNRQFRKLEKIVAAGKHQMGAEIQKILDISINNPMELISSDDNLIIFEGLIHEMVNLTKSGKIDLDKREIKNLETASSLLPSKLRNIKHKLASLTENSKIKEKDSQSPALSEAVKLENLIKKLNQERRETQATLEQLQNRLKLIEEELVSKRDNLQRLASKVLGSRVEITF